MKLRFSVALVAALTIACAGKGKSPGKTAFDAHGRPIPVARGDEGRGVSLTGEHAYDDRHDPSGWSGKTATPGAIGGGPKAEPSASLPPPPPSPAPSAAPSPSAKPLPPSKELDTSPPSKELQF